MAAEYDSVTQQFDVLPPELIHQILDDLPILKVLEISMGEHASPYLKACIQSHPHHSAVFSLEEWEELKNYVRLWVKIHANPKIEDSQSTSTRNIASFIIPVCGLEKSLAQAADSYEYLIDTFGDFQTAIWRRLAGYGWDVILQPYSPVPLTGHFSTRVRNLVELQDTRAWLETRWRAEMIMNQVKEDQLRRMVSLLQRCTEALRIAPDRRQEPIRNAQHVIKQIMHEAALAVHPHFPMRKLAGQRVFARPTLYLIPYDRYDVVSLDLLYLYIDFEHRYLRVFLKILVKYPPNDESSFQAAQSLQGSPPRRVVKRHEYPPSMTTVIQGLRFIYPRDAVNDPLVSRTVPPLPTAAQTRRRIKKGQFQFYSTINPEGGPFSPASDKEMEWLEAFLSICTYISSMDGEWQPGQTVGEFWKAHI